LARRGGKLAPCPRFALAPQARFALELPAL
jgi:hypothetical protein